MDYDYIIVGAGLFGSVFTHEAVKNGKRCLVIEKRNHIGGNAFTENVEGIQVHKYGPHIFHTNSSEIWNYMQQFCEFNNYINSPIAIYKGEVYNLPFNMNTFHKIWGVVTPEEAKEVIDNQIEQYQIIEPENLEEQALKLVGKDIYEKLIKGYTEKQWGKPCSELPAFIIKRIPVRFTYNNNYFNDRYQGIPVGGYTQIFEKMLEGADLLLNTDALTYIKNNKEHGSKIIYTGMIDEFYNFVFGHLDYRSLRFETEVINCENYQGNAVINYTDNEIPYTRVVEHKHFDYVKQPNTVITKEYPCNWESGKVPYYPVNDVRNMQLYNQYSELAAKEENVVFGGRLGSYRYFNMDEIILEAIILSRNEFK